MIRDTWEARLRRCREGADDPTITEDVRSIRGGPLGEAMLLQDETNWKRFAHADTLEAAVAEFADNFPHIYNRDAEIRCYADDKNWRAALRSLRRLYRDVERAGGPSRMFDRMDEA